MDEETRLEESFQDYTEAVERLPVDKELVDQLRSQTIDLQGADWTVRTCSLPECVLQEWVDHGQAPHFLTVP